MFIGKKKLEKTPAPESGSQTGAGQDIGKDDSQEIPSRSGL